jgi:hypothetical protein
MVVDPSMESCTRSTRASRPCDINRTGKFVTVSNLDMHARMFGIGRVGDEPDSASAPADGRAAPVLLVPSCTYVGHQQLLWLPAGPTSKWWVYIYSPSNITISKFFHIFGWMHIVGNPKCGPSYMVPFLKFKFVILKFQNIPKNTICDRIQ